MRSERNRQARSNYDQLRMSVTRAVDGSRTMVIWFKDKHQDWKYAHIVYRGQLDDLEGLTAMESCISAAGYAISEYEEQLERGSRLRF